MHPVLFHVGTLAVSTYGVTMGLGLFVGLLYGTVQARKDGLPGEWAWDLGLVAMVCAVVGSRLEYVRTHFERFAGSPGDIFVLRDGGLVFYGGFVASLFGFWAYARWRKVPVLALFDLMAPSVGFGHAIGRIGCLSTGCCFGQPTDGVWAITFPEGSLAPAGVPLVPTQVNEVLFNLAMGLFLAWVPRRFVGQRFVLLIWLYPAFRAVNETLRGDAARGWVFDGLMTNGQLTSLVLIAVGAVIWGRARKAA